MTSTPTGSIRAGLLAALLLAVTACGADPVVDDAGDAGAADAPTAGAGRAAPEPAPGPTIHPAGSSSATPSAPSKAEQARLDEQLREAAWVNDVDRADALIRRGADVNAKDDTEQSAYLIATSEGYLDLLNLTLAHGADIDDKDSWNGTGLIRAAERGHFLVVGRLLQAGIDRDHVNRIGYQAIHEAIWLGEDTTTYVDTVRSLVAGGVELDRPSGQEGLTPMRMAEQRGFAALESVVAAALDPTTIRNPDRALLQAAAAGRADDVARALRAGADLEARDARDRTARQLAAADDRSDVVRLLVAMGARP